MLDFNLRHRSPPPPRDTPWTLFPGMYSSHPLVLHSLGRHNRLLVPCVAVSVPLFGRTSLFVTLGGLVAWQRNLFNPGYQYVAQRLRYRDPSQKNLEIVERFPKGLSTISESRLYE